MYTQINNISHVNLNSDSSVINNTNTKIDKQENYFILNINYILLRKWFLFFFVYSALISLLVFGMHATANTPIHLSVYFYQFFHWIFLGALPLVFTVGVILFIVLIVIKMFKLIFNVKKRL